MNPNGRIAAVRASFAGLGPLRAVALYVAAAPAIGMLVLFPNLPRAAAALTAAPAAAPGVVTAVIAAATAFACLPPVAAAFAAGYCLGASFGTWCTVAGVALGSVPARGVLAPALPASWFAFMRERPRAVAVRRLCAGPLRAATMGVARVRWSHVLPTGIANLLFAVAGVPARAVLAGSLLGALPAVLLAAVAGDRYALWSVAREPWTSRELVAMAAASIGAAMLWRASRRAWRRVTS